MTIGWRLARLEGRAVRALYRVSLPVVSRRAIDTERRIPMSMVSFSSSSDLAEQVLSIRSMLKHAGRPTRFVVVSDGSHDDRQIALLERLDPCVSVVRWDEFATADALEATTSLTRSTPMGKKLAIELSLWDDGPTAYLDSDVLFFAGSHCLGSLVEGDGPAAWFLSDCDAYLDSRMLREADRSLEPVNAGFFVLQQPISWDGALKRLDALDEDFTWMSEQTAVHVAMHEAGAQSLDASAYVLSDRDAWGWADRFTGPDLVMRHYTTPVRHKMWASLSRRFVHSRRSPTTSRVVTAPG